MRLRLSAHRSLLMVLQALIPVLPLEIWVVSPTLICEDARHVVEVAQDALDTMNTFPPQPIRLRLAKSRPVEDRKGQPFAEDPGCFLKEYDPNSGRPALKLHLVPDEDATGMKLSFDPHSARADLVFGEVSTRALGSYVASAVYSIFAEERASLAHKFVAQGSSGTAVTYLQSVPEDIKSAVTSRENRALKYASTYHLTFSLFTPGGSPSSWDIESALETYIKPWIAAFSTISNFSINTQIQPYSAYSPSIRPFKDEGRDQTLLRREDLSAFINAAEWPLSPSVGSHGPTMNFVLYVPSASEVPLTIASSNGGTSWLIPQWGGVAILSPPLRTNELTGQPSVPHHLDLDSLRIPFETFTSQLLSLLGLPTTLQPQPQTTTTTTTTNPPHLLPLPLRLQTHTRLQTLSLHLLARSTLASLSRLTTSLPNIPIPATVASLVSSTLSHLHSTCTELQSSNWDAALAHARQAWQDSEKAFFEKSMVGQVYFPDEHKVAVYLPLLGPVGVPLLLGLGRLVGRSVAGLRGGKGGGGVS